MKHFRRILNFRDLGGIPTSDGKESVPSGLFFRSGKLSVLSREECTRFLESHHIKCVIDLRTPLEALEFPDPLPESVEYLQIPILKDATVGITHETGSDPMTIIRNLRKHPEKLKEMMPDFNQLYRLSVTDAYCRKQLDQVVDTLRRNAENRVCTLFHCTAGKDRTGIASMALLKSYGVSDEEIVKDYLKTNKNAFWPTMKKCMGVAILTRNWSLVKTAYQSFMADKKLMVSALSYYDHNPTPSDCSDCSNHSDHSDMKNLSFTLLLSLTVTLATPVNMEAASVFLALSGDSTTIDHASPTEGVVNHVFVDETRMKDDLLQMLARFAAYMKKDFQECKEPNSLNELCGCFKGENTMGSDERGVRPNADLSMVCAFLVKYGKGRVELPDSVTWDDLQQMAMKSLVFAYSTHKANQLKVCAGNRYWGSTSVDDAVWESSLWAMSVAYSAFFQWHLLSDIQKTYVYQLLKAECNYELNRPIPTGFKGDTKAEENGWEVDVLAATLGLFPDDELASKWFERLREFAINCHSQKDDADNSQVVDMEYDGKTVKDLYRGQNLYDDYSLQNHDYFHTSYQNVVIQELGEAALALKLFQKELYGEEKWKTKSLMHNNDKVMENVLYWLALADGELAMPNGNDWSLFLYDQITSYSTNACFLRDPHALMLENLAYKMIKARQTTTEDGAWLLNPDVGARRMGVQAHRVMMTWLMHEMMSTADMKATEWGDFNRQFGRAKVFYTQNIVRAANEHRFTTFSWSKGLSSYTGYIAANSVDKNKIVVPFRFNNTGNFLGWYEVKGKGTNAKPVVDGVYQLDGNSFVMNGEINTNDSTLNHRFVLYSSPGNAVVYADLVRANDSVTIVKERGGLMAISVDELTKTKRTFHTADGVKWLDGSGMVTMGGAWVNVDDVLGIVTDGGKQMAFGEKALNNSIMTAKLYASFSDASRRESRGGVVDHRAMTYYSNIDAETTAQLAKLNRQLPVAEGWNAVLAFDPDSTGYLLLAHFAGERRCMLKDVNTPFGAPVIYPRCIINEKGTEIACDLEENNAMAQVVRFHIDGVGVEVWNEGSDVICLRNLIKGSNIVTVKAFLNGRKHTKVLKLKKKTIRIIGFENELLVEKVRD